MSTEVKDAVISRCEKYRYVLSRVWDISKPLVMFIGLNPSTADAHEDDPTIRRLRGFAKAWGYGGFFITNLFAFRATQPADLKKAEQPFGGSNHFYMLETAAKCQEVVFAWGADGSYLDADRSPINLFPNAKCLGHTKGGHPKHPLYLRQDTQLIPFKR